MFITDLALYTIATNLQRNGLKKRKDKFEALMKYF